MRDHAPVPLPLFLWNVRLLLPLSESLWNLPSDFVPFWAVVEPVLSPCGKLDVHFHPTTQCGQVSAAPNLLPEPIFWPRFDASLSTLRLSSQQGQSQLQPNPHSILHVHALLPLLPIVRPGPLQKHFLQIFWANVSHVDSDFAFKKKKKQGLPMRSLDTQITGLAHHCSCRSSYLLPQASVHKDREVVLVVLCLLNFNLSVGAISTALPPLQVLAGTMPALNKLLTPPSCGLFGMLYSPW